MQTNGGKRIETRQNQILTEKVERAEERGGLTKKILDRTRNWGKCLTARAERARNRGKGVDAGVEREFKCILRAQVFK